MPKITNKDIRFRQGLMMGLRIAYINVYREKTKYKEALSYIQEHHDEYADIDKSPKIFEIPGMDIYAPSKNGNKGRKSKHS